jgi:hypothetical protein
LFLLFLQLCLIFGAGVRRSWSWFADDLGLVALDYFWCERTAGQILSFLIVGGLW